MGFQSHEREDPSWSTHTHTIKSLKGSAVALCFHFLSPAWASLFFPTVLSFTFPPFFLSHCSPAQCLHQGAVINWEPVHAVARITGITAKAWWCVNRPKWAKLGHCRVYWSVPGGDHIHTVMWRGLHMTKSSSAVCFNSHWMRKWTGFLMLKWKEKNVLFIFIFASLNSSPALFFLI